jgi:hypothetical protein
MKVIFTDNQWGSDIELIPETIKEAADLFRLARNASSKKPYISQSFNNRADNPGKLQISIDKRSARLQISIDKRSARLQICIDKRSARNQLNSVNPNNK